MQAGRQGGSAPASTHSEEQPATHRNTEKTPEIPTGPSLSFSLPLSSSPSSVPKDGYSPGNNLHRFRDTPGM